MASRSVNKVIIMGNMVRDPELRYTSKGTPICTFSLATNRDWRPSDSDDVREETEFHNIVAWSKLAELCAELLYKGRRVYVEGRLQTRDWTDEESGKKMYRTEIVAEEMIALGPPKEGKPDDEDAAGTPAQSQPADTTPEVQLREEPAADEAQAGSDIPF
jgi:single-strand DNA-binding protein